ncbi:FecCD family ABC transporter permease [Rhizobium rhizosphaerae]|uniref:FecCD family ABC transporter permease n=1 Tax=Xaviernesmea rhizosphaerae TaxID=1672749 RepID=UPI0009C0B1F6|nr:iron ABC transporter permease [Xaviernesmea rhizosphaerae]
MRFSILCLTLALLLAALFAASLALGDVPVSWRALAAVLGGGSDVSPDARMIVVDLRLPRVLLGALVGMALAIAGTISIAIMRNPLAEPGVLGINGGAAVGAMVVIVALRDPPVFLLQASGFVGALVLAAAVYLLSWRGGTASLRIVLIGVGLSALTGAVTSLLAATGDLAAVQRAMIWLAGSVYDASLLKVERLLSWLILPAALTLALARELDLIAFGDGTAKSLGQPVERVRALMILLCTVISGAAVAVSGLIGFVGLLAPHIARRLAGPAHLRILPVAALVGACLVTAADLLGRLVIAPGQVPAGIVTGLLGAPFFIYLLWGRRHGKG